MSLRHKTFSAAIQNTPGDRRCSAICSTDDVDETGEVVVVQNLDLTKYRRNPVVLFSHAQDMPIGRAANVRVDGNRLLADLIFAPEGTSAKADEIYRLVVAGIIRSVSIGFNPTQTEPMDPSRPRGPQRYLRAELVEISAVSCPANTNAVITDKSYQHGRGVEEARQPQLSLMERTSRERAAHCAAVGVVSDDAKRAQRVLRAERLRRSAS